MKKLLFSVGISGVAGVDMDMRAKAFRLQERGADEYAGEKKKKKARSGRATKKRMRVRTIQKHKNSRIPKC